MQINLKSMSTYMIQSDVIILYRKKSDASKHKSRADLSDTGVVNE